MLRIATLVTVGWLIAGSGYAQEDAAAEPAPATEAGEAEPTRAERRERRRAQQADEAQAALADTSEQAAEDAADDEGLICRRESVVGTHRRVRICTTRAQREAMRESSQELIRDVTRNRGRLDPEGQ